MTGGFYDQADIVRHVGLYSRDLFELFGCTQQIPLDETATVRWDDEKRVAVFVGLHARELVVAEATLDAHPYVLARSAVDAAPETEVAGA